MQPTPALKSILKNSSAPKVNPVLLGILRDLHYHKKTYTKEQMEFLLQPFIKSGELKYLRDNPKLLETELALGAPVQP